MMIRVFKNSEKVAKRRFNEVLTDQSCFKTRIYGGGGGKRWRKRKRKRKRKGKHVKLDTFRRQREGIRKCGKLSFTHPGFCASVCL